VAQNKVTKPSNKKSANKATFFVKFQWCNRNLTMLQVSIKCYCALSCDVATYINNKQ